MKKILGLLILITFGFNSNKKNISELDLIDAYSLKVKNVDLFGDISSQLDLFGLPKNIFQGSKELEFQNSNDILSTIKKAKNFSVVAFEGIEFWCFSDLESIPSKIDFRKLNKKISNKNLTLSKEYGLNDFKKDFPNSFSNSPKTPVSFFQMATKENLSDLKHYFVERNTKSDSEKKLLVEFTFENDELIYIFFTNF